MQLPFHPDCVGLYFMADALRTDFAPVLVFFLGFALFRMQSLQVVVMRAFGRACGHASSHSGTVLQCASDQLSAEPHARAAMLADTLARLRDAIRDGDLDQAVRNAITLESAGQEVPANCLVELVRRAGQQGAMRNVLRSLPVRVQLPAEAIVALAEHAAEAEDSWLLRAAQRKAAALGVSLPPSSLKALSRACAHLSVSRAVEVLEEMAAAGHEAPEDAFSITAARCAEAGEAALVDRLLASARRSRGSVSPSLYCSCLRAYGAARRLEEACGLVGAMEADGADMDAATCDCIVEAAGGHLESATRAFGQLPVGVAGWGAGFRALLKAFAQHRQGHLALETYEAVGPDAPISTKEYNALLGILFNHGDADAALRIFRDMILRGAMPDKDTYVFMVRGHCARGELEPVLQLLGQMRRQGLQPDQALFNAVLDACAHKRMLAIAEQILLDMESAGVRPSCATLSIIVRLYGRCGDLGAALEAVESLPKRHGFDANAQVLGSLVAACVANEDVERALEVYGRMANAGFVADAHTYRSLLAGCVRAEDVGSAVRLVEDALGADGQRLLLDRDTVEGVLMMITRLGCAAEVAVTLLERLESVGASVGPQVAAAVRGDQMPAVKSRFHQRRVARAST